MQQKVKADTFAATILIRQRRCEVTQFYVCLLCAKRDMNGPLSLVIGLPLAVYWHSKECGVPFLEFFGNEKLTQAHSLDGSRRKFSVERARRAYRNVPTNLYGLLSLNFTLFETAEFNLSSANFKN
ncbi:unnamed protein product [Strongylus vulgaris]|uniref:Uncharacterized protein n=1 Tax=Strongylus vulgaris TaxID=40348 RepID=A0A3P7IY88_STRVU|nr:unnamed protein product [Strongylus vulgaris]